MSTPVLDSYLKSKLQAEHFILHMFDEMIAALQEVWQNVDNLEASNALQLVQQNDKNYWYLPSAEAAMYYPIATKMIEVTSNMDENFRLHFDPPSPTWLYLVDEFDYAMPGSQDDQRAIDEGPTTNATTIVNETDPNSQTELLRRWQIQHEHKHIFRIAGVYVKSVEITLKDFLGFFSRPVTLGGQDRYIEHEVCLIELEYALEQLRGIREEIYGDTDLPVDNHTGDGPWDPMNKMDMEYAIWLYRQRHSWTVNMSVLTTIQAHATS